MVFVFLLFITISGNEHNHTFGNLAISYLNCTAQLKLRYERSPCKIFGNTVGQGKIIAEYFVSLFSLLILVYLATCVCHSSGKI
jgi:hypothetical protein